MRKAILKKFIQLLFLALALNTFIFYVVTSSMLLKKTRSNMMFALETADSLFDYSDDLQEQAGMLKKVADMNQSRFTIVKKDGTVEVDTEVSNAAAMENHMEREEVKEALQYGSGHSIRKSETLGIQMLYVARMSSNGEYIFRLASPYSGMQEYLIMLLPAVLPAGWAAEEDPPPPQAASMLTIITMASKNASLERCFFMFFVLLYMC